MQPRCSWRALLAAVTLAQLTAFSLSAQIMGGGNLRYFRFKGTGKHGSFGGSVAGAGDVDKDGYPDLIVGASGADPGNKGSIGSALVFSGKDGALLVRFDGPAVYSGFGQSVANAGDVDKDGYVDVIVGAPRAGKNREGSAFVYSGKTKSLLMQLDGAAAGDSFGSAVSGAGDVDGDGHADLIVGASGADPGGRGSAGSAYVYSGKTKALLMQRDGAAAGDSFGWSVAGAGDVNRDGYDEVIVGAPGASPGNRPQAGSFFVYSVKDKKLWMQVDGSANHGLGWSVAGGRDVNKDGYDDVLVAAPAFGSSDPAAYVYSGKDKSMLMKVGSSKAGVRAVAFGRDFNRDGYDDLIVGVANGAHVYSGKDSSLLTQIFGSPGQALGSSVASAGDINKDGLDNVIVGDPRTANGPGSAYVFVYEPYITTTSTTVSAATHALVGYQMAFPGAANAPYVVLVSATGTGPFHLGIPVPLSLDSLVLATFFGGLGPPVLQTGFRGKLDGAGRAAAFIGFPKGSLDPFVGVNLYFAALAIPAGSLPTHSSAAVPLRIQK